jgi:hypothetical protein
VRGGRSTFRSPGVILSRSYPVKGATAQGFYRLISALGAESVYNHADFRLMSRRAVEALKHVLVGAGWYHLLAQVWVTAVVFMWNFVGNSVWTFRAYTGP